MVLNVVPVIVPPEILVPEILPPDISVPEIVEAEIDPFILALLQVNLPSLVTLRLLPKVIEPLLIVRFVAVILFAVRLLILPPVAVKLSVVIVPVIFAFVAFKNPSFVT